LLIDPEPLLATRTYRVLCHDATLIDLEAEGMWPMGAQLEVHHQHACHRPTATGRGAAMQTSRRRLVLRDDGAVWPPRRVDDGGPLADVARGCEVSS
jgi:hypothetical protein